MLKFFLVIIIFFSSCSKAVCQLEKGTWLVGGNGFFSRSNNSFQSISNPQSSKSTSVKISPNIGYFLVDKLASGLKISYSLEKDRVNGPGGGYSDQRYTEFGPFVRYYFLDKEKQVNILSEVSYQYGVYKAPPFDGPVNTFSFLSGPVVYFNSAVGLECLVGYYSRTEDVGAYINSRKAFQIVLGFQIHLQN